MEVISEALWLFLSYIVMLGFPHQVAKLWGLRTEVLFQTCFKTRKVLNKLS